MGKLSVVVGGQYGSEAKGAVTGWLSKQDEAPIVVRVAGPNAGHTAHDPQGRAWALRQIPVGMVANLQAHGVIADGSEVDLQVLLQEIHELEASGIPVRNRLTVSRYATLLTDTHRDAETDSEISTRIGSTGKGIGAARADRIMRIADTFDTVLENGTVDAFYRERYSGGHDQLALDLDWGSILSPAIPEWLHQELTSGRHVIIEGTQGYGLGLHRPEYPQVTSSDARAIDFLAMAGLNPWHPGVTSFDVWVVVRAFPIRVAGNSGPLYEETTWEELGLPEELTTVTRKVRRVGRWDQQLFNAALEANGGPRAVKVAYSMADQEAPSLAGLDGDISTLMESLSDPQREAIGEIISRTRGLARYIGTGPNTRVWVSER